MYNDGKMNHWRALLSIAAMRYPGGALAQVTSSVVHHGEEQQVIFQTERARFRTLESLRISFEGQRFPLPQRNPRGGAAGGL